MTDPMKKAARATLALLALLVIAGVISCKPDIKKELMTGDIIFQTLPGELSEAISAITGSPLSHCGMVIKKDDNALSVIEAVGPVRIVPLDDFIASGIDSRFTVVRFIDADQLDFDDIISEARKFLGRPYDYLYRFDDENIYCSELLYKAFYNSAKIKIAKLVKLKELDYKARLGFIKSITGGKVPLEREMVTPVDIYTSDKFNEIFTNYY